jgi:hypothetical protein
VNIIWNSKFNTLVGQLLKKATPELPTSNVCTECVKKVKYNIKRSELLNYLSLVVTKGERFEQGAFGR